VAKLTRWLTYRKVLTPVVLAAASGLLWFGKLTSGDWMVTALGCLAGHHLADVLRAARGRD
jgi:hypothetical protein